MRGKDKTLLFILFFNVLRYLFLENYWNSIYIVQARDVKIRKWEQTNLCRYSFKILNYISWPRAQLYRKHRNPSSPKLQRFRSALHSRAHPSARIRTRASRRRLHIYYWRASQTARRASFTIQSFRWVRHWIISENYGKWRVPPPQLFITRRALSRRAAERRGRLSPREPPLKVNGVILDARFFITRLCQRRRVSFAALVPSRVVYRRALR